MATVILRPASDFYTVSGRWSISSGGTYRYDRVSEAVADELSTYLLDASTLSYDPGIVDFGMTTTPPVDGYSIDKITVTVRGGYHASGGNTRYIRPRVNQIDYATYSTYTGTAWTNSSWDYTKNPTTNLPWQWADLDTLKIGLAGYTSNSKTQIYVTQVYVTVTYSSGYGNKVNGVIVDKVNGVIPDRVCGV